MRKILLLLVAALVLSACGQAPDSLQLQRDVEKGLQETFGDGVFEITNLVRRGTAVDSTAPAGENQRIVYYDVTLKLKKEMTLGAWDQPGAAALVSLFGAGPRSIRGIKSSGNQIDDLITAHASAIYRKEDNNWHFVMPTGLASAESPTLDLATQTSGIERLRNTLEETLHSVPYNHSNAARKVVDEELERSLTRINTRLARLQQGFVFAGGPERGEYLTFTQALTSIAYNRQVRLVPLITAGSAENIGLLRTGGAAIGLAQADMALLAYQGKGLFEPDGPFTELRALGSLYPELVHVIVRQDSSMTNIRDLQGKRISIGLKESGHVILQEILTAHGLIAGKNYELVGVPLSTALQQLNSGELDAIVQAIGIPSGILRSAIPQANLKLLPLEPEVIEKLVKSNPAVMALHIPKGTYPDQTTPVTTVGTVALLLATTELTANEAATIVNTVFQQGQDIVAAGSVQGAQLSVETATLGLTVPLHDGAIDALQKLRAQRQSP